MDTVRDILIYLHHNLITIDEADSRIRQLRINTIDTFNPNCEHEALKRITDMLGRDFEICEMCGYSKQLNIN